MSKRRLKKIILPTVHAKTLEILCKKNYNLSMVSKEQYNRTVADNLIKYRKHFGFTQASLAEKLNYSDKAIAKWESGESLPEAYVLSQIAEIYGITVNDLLIENKKIKMPFNKLKFITLSLFSNCILWLVTLICFTILSGLDFENAWFSFIVSIPLTFILVLIFSSIFKNKLFQFISISGIIWTTLLVVHLLLIKVTSVSYYVYFIGVPIQIFFAIPYVNKIIAKLK